MKDKIGIWIDHKKAVIVSASADRVTATTLESDIGPHTRYSGRAGYPTPDGPQDGGGEKKYEERYDQHLDRYYDKVISQMGQPEALLIFGPGEAKLQLRERLARSKALSERIVRVETTDKLTDPQIVAKVKEHYGIDHREEGTTRSHQV
jgi:phage-related protein